MIWLISLLSYADVYERPTPKIFYSGELPESIGNAALLQSPELRKLNLNAEQWGVKQLNYLGIPETAVLFIIAGTNALALRQFSTKTIHFYYAPIKGLTIRPDLVYSLNKDTQFLLTFTWESK